jgi:glucose/arabinose dehydrogenase
MAASSSLDPTYPHKAVRLDRYFSRQFGRLRDVVEGPDRALYLLTSNRDGRGSPAPDDDRVIRLSLK